MKLFSIFIYLLISQTSWAQIENCFNKIDKFITEPSEKFLWEKYKHQRVHWIKNCNSDISGDHSLLEGITFIHETTHNEDLNQTGKQAQFDLYLVDGKHIGAPLKISLLPKVSKLILPI